MGLISKALKFGAVVALLLSLVVGSFMAGIPRRFGFFSVLAKLQPSTTHLWPTFTAIDYEWGYTFEQLAQADLTGQTALVTGANNGTGYWTSLALARAGASVTLGCRSRAKCDAAVAQIKANTTRGKLSTLLMDTSDLSSVHAAALKFANRTSKLNMLFLNAGIVAAQGDGPSGAGSLPLSVDGIEAVFATNYLGHHLLYKVLAPALQASNRARVVLTTSGSHFDSYNYGVATDLETLNNPPQQGSMLPYGQSKLAQILWAQELTERLGPDSNVYVNSYHPGMAATAISATVPLLDPAAIQYLWTTYVMKMMWTAEEGALTGVYLGVESHGHRGKYFHPMALLMESSDDTRNPQLQKALWEFSEHLVAQY